MEEELNFEKTMNKIKEAMNMQAKFEKEIKDKEDELDIEISPRTVKKGEEDLKIKKEDLEEFKEMTKQAILRTRQAKLEKREKAEKEYQDKLIETSNKQKNVAKQVEKMKARGLSPEKLVMLENSSKKIMDKVNSEMKDFQKNHLEERALLDNYEKKLAKYELAIEHGVSMEEITEDVVSMESEKTTAETIKSEEQEKNVKEVESTEPANEKVGTQEVETVEPESEPIRVDEEIVEPIDGAEERGEVIETNKEETNGGKKIEKIEDTFPPIFKIIFSARNKSYITLDDGMNQTEDKMLNSKERRKIRKSAPKELRNKIDPNVVWLLMTSDVDYDKEVLLPSYYEALRGKKEDIERFKNILVYEFSYSKLNIFENIRAHIDAIKNKNISKIVEKEGLIKRLVNNISIGKRKLDKGQENTIEEKDKKEPFVQHVETDIDKALEAMEEQFEQGEIEKNSENEINEVR